jgi:uncharacterized membrane protein
MISLRYEKWTFTLNFGDSLVKAFLLLLFLLGGGSFIAMAIPLIERKVKPNGWYGFRTPWTMSDPDIWYPVNEFGGRRFLWVGVTEIVAAVILFFIPQLSIDAYCWGVLAAVLLALVVTGIQMIRYLRRFPKRKPGDKQLS